MTATTKVIIILHMTVLTDHTYSLLVFFLLQLSQMEDGHTLFDYDVGLNDIVQLMIRPFLSVCGDSKPVPTVADKVTKQSSHNGVQSCGAEKKETMNGDLECESDDEAMDTVGFLLLHYY